MNDYTDIIYLMGAMIVFSMLSTQAARMFQLNSQNMVQSEIEYNAVAVGQDYLDQIRWINDQGEFNDFITEFPKDKVVVSGDEDQFEMTYEVVIDVQDIALAGNANTTNKLVTVTVKNEYLKKNPLDLDSELKEIQIQGIKSFN